MWMGVKTILLEIFFEKDQRFGYWRIGGNRVPSD
jgi:hypothetical protein